ncbi:MAG: YceD family protein [Candidatus Limnocylindrales bacterium]
MNRSAADDLVFNVAGLLAEPAGSVRDFVVAVAPLDLGPDLRQLRDIEGELRLTRTNRGLLVTGRLTTAIEQTCSRCLGEIEWPVEIELEEEALPSLDFITGLPVDMADEPDALRLTDHHELDLEGEVRDWIVLAEPIAPVCRDDCPGLCIECGEELASGPHHHAGDEIDPRLETLRGFVEASERD